MVGTAGYGRGARKKFCHGTHLYSPLVIILFRKRRESATWLIQLPGQQQQIEETQGSGIAPFTAQKLLSGEHDYSSPGRENFGGLYESIKLYSRCCLEVLPGDFL